MDLLGSLPFFLLSDTKMTSPQVWKKLNWKL